MNAARAPRFTPLHAENGDSAVTAGFPALSPAWDDPGSSSPGPSSPGRRPRRTALGRRAIPARHALLGELAGPAAVPSWDDPPLSTPAAAAPPPAASTGPLPSVPSNGTSPAFGTSLSGDGASQPPRLPTRPVRSLGSSDPGRSPAGSRGAAGRPGRPGQPAADL